MNIHDIGSRIRDLNSYLDLEFKRYEIICEHARWRRESWSRTRPLWRRILDTFFWRCRHTNFKCCSECCSWVRDTGHCVAADRIRIAGKLPAARLLPQRTA